MTLFVIFVYAVLIYLFRVGNAKVFYTQCLIMLTCVVLIVSNNIVRGDFWYAPLIFIGAASSFGLFAIQLRIQKPG